MSELLLLARWWQLMDGRADIGVVENRLLRRIIELMPDRGYMAELQARRDHRVAAQCSAAANDAAVLARRGRIRRRPDQLPSAPCDMPRAGAGR